MGLTVQLQLPSLREVVATPNLHELSTEQFTPSILQRLIAEQESTKSLLVANKALQSSVDQSEGHLKAASVRCETLQSHVLFMQSLYQHLEGHLACVTDCLQSQYEPDGNPVDVAALVSQVWTYRKQLVDLEYLWR